MAKLSASATASGPDSTAPYARDEVFAHLMARARLARGDASAVDQALASRFRDHSDPALTAYNQAVFDQIGPTADEQDIADWIEAAAADLNASRSR